MNAPKPGSAEWAAKCACACGRPAPIAKRTNAAKGHVKGHPVRFLMGHGGRRGSDSIPARERFWDHVPASSAGECWEWRGCRSPKGYGRITDGNQGIFAHRLSYELANGSIPVGMEVRHSCDNPPCVNPAHLLLGSSADNSRDAVERDRTAHGERNPAARLTSEVVRQIRRRVVGGESISSVSRTLGVARATVRRAANGTTWRRVA